MIGFFETTCYLIGLTFVAATFFCCGMQDTFIRNNRSLNTSFAYGYWELNKIVHFKKVFTFAFIWTALIGLAIAES